MAGFHPATRGRWWFAGSLVVLAASFALCVALTYSQPDATFYLLPTRAWELAIGSLAALAGARIDRDGGALAPTPAVSAQRAEWPDSS